MRIETIEDIYMLEEQLSTPGILEGMLQAAAKGSPDYQVIVDDDGFAGVFIKALNDNLIPLGPLPAGAIAQADRDLNAMATEMAAGTEPAGAQPMTLGEFATSAADVPAGLMKGSIQGSVGLAGDLISLGRGIAAALNPMEGEDPADAFLRGLDLPTGAPTTEDVKQFLNTWLGQVVPSGVTDERRREASKTPETVGEFIGAGKTVKELVKTGVTRSRAKAKGTQE